MYCPTIYTVALNMSLVVLYHPYTFMARIIIWGITNLEIWGHGPFQNLMKAE